MFWKEVLVVWRKIQRKHIPSTVEDVLKSCIWENDVFKTTKKDMNLKTWCKAGIYYVNDLVHLEEGRFMTFKDIYGLESFFSILKILMHASKGILNLPTSSLHLCSPFQQNR